jgi:NhaP-type Na+/H+ or K+/H+ antiporter
LKLKSLVFRLVENWCYYTGECAVCKGAVFVSAQFVLVHVYVTGWVVEYLGTRVAIQFIPVSWHTPGFIGFKELFLCPANFSSGCQMSCSFQSQNTLTFLTMDTNILTLAENICSSRTAINWPITKEELVS